jgi:integrase
VKAWTEDRRWKTGETTGKRKRTSYRGDEPWRVRWLTDERTASGNRRKPSRSFRSQTEANDYMLALEGGTRRGDWIDPHTAAVMFEVLADMWFDTTKALQPHTRRGYWKLLHTHVLPYFGGMPQNTIDRITVKQFAADKLAAGYSPKYVRDMLSVISLVMVTAMDLKLRVDNPAARHKIEVRQKKLTEGDTITLAEAHRLVAATRDPYKPLVWILIICGLRPAEVCGLLVKHVDFTRLTLHAEETWNFVQGFGDVPATTYRGVTKSAAGDRFIPLPKFVMEMLAQMLAQRSEGRGTPIDQDEPLFESIRGGKPLKVPDLRRRIILPALEGSGLSTRIRTYDTRHSHAFILIDDGANMLEVAQRMGHDPIVLQRVYGHVADIAQQQLTDRLETLIHEAAPAAESTGTEGTVIDLFSRRRSNT